MLRRLSAGLLLVLVSACIKSPVDWTTQRSTPLAGDSTSVLAADGTLRPDSMLAPEGPGLFFAHSMDEGVTFHTPVAILYGDRLGRTSVAADGDIVVVGFEDPNSRTPRVGLAISRTMGHIFEQRILPLSDDVGTATRPLTAVRGRQIAVAWEQRASPTAPAALDVRVGTLR